MIEDGPRDGLGGTPGNEIPTGESLMAAPEDDTTRPVRKRQAKQIFTPSKNISINDHDMGYSLDPVKALKKKIKGASRTTDCIIEHKSGNLILTLSTAAYELMKLCTINHFQNDANRSCKITTKSSTNSRIRTKLIIEESLSIKPKTGGRQLFRINFYNTTSKVEINGLQMIQFAQHDLPEICKELGKYKNMEHLNTLIISKCKQTLEQLNSIQKRGEQTEIESEHTQICDHTQENDVDDHITLPKSYSLNEDKHRSQLTLPRKTHINSSSCVLLVPYSDRQDSHYSEMINTADPEDIEMCPSIDFLCPLCNIDTDGEKLECQDCQSWIHTACDPRTEKNLLTTCLLYTCPSCAVLNEDKEVTDQLTPALTPEKKTAVASKSILPNLVKETNITEQSIPNLISQVNKKLNERNHPPTAAGMKRTHAQSARYLIPQKRSPGRTDDQNVYNPDIDIAETTDNCKKPKYTEMQKECDLTQKPKKKKSSVDAEFADCRARASILEQQNRDYKNTIDLMTEKLDRLAVDHRSEHTNTQADNIEFMKMRLQITHRMDLLETRLQGQIENSNLQLQLKILETQKEICNLKNTEQAKTIYIPQNPTYYPQPMGMPPQPVFYGANPILRPQYSFAPGNVMYRPPTFPARIPVRVHTHPNPYTTKATPPGQPAYAAAPKAPKTHIEEERNPPQSKSTNVVDEIVILDESDVGIGNNHKMTNEDTPQPSDTNISKENTNPDKSTRDEHKKRTQTKGKNTHEQIRKYHSQKENANSSHSEDEAKSRNQMKKDFLGKGRASRRTSRTK